MVGNRYRGKDLSSRNVPVDQHAKLGADRKRSASVGASSRETQSSKDENFVKCRAMRLQGQRKRLLSSQKENNTAKKMFVKKEAKVPEHRSRLFIDETSDVVSASNDDPVYNLRKEIRNWRESGQLNEFERERFIIEDGTKKNVLQVNHGKNIAKNSGDPDVLSESASSIIADRLTRCTCTLTFPPRKTVLTEARRTSISGIPVYSRP